MRGVLGRCPLLAIAASYLVAAGVFVLAVLQAAHGQWQCLLLFAGTCAGFLAGSTEMTRPLPPPPALPDTNSQLLLVILMCVTFQLYGVCWPLPRELCMLVTRQRPWNEVPSAEKVNSQLPACGVPPVVCQ